MLLVQKMRRMFKKLLTPLILTTKQSEPDFPPNARVIVQHTASGQNLAAEVLAWMLTFFGADCTVSCETYRDSRKMERAENMWMVQSDV